MLFELNKYDRSLHCSEAAVPSSPYLPVSDIDRVSLLYWGEHCIECAAPSCYQTCDLYRPRADHRCRRFAFGAFKNKNFPSLHGHGVEIAFKKWAKMEAYANLRLHGVGTTIVSQRLVERAAPLADVVGKVMARILRKSRWQTVTHVALDEVVRRLDRTRSAKDFPDAFLLEIYNPNKEVIRVQLSFTSLPPASGDSREALVKLSQGFRDTVVCQPGYCRYEVNSAQLRRVADAGPFLVSLSPEADQDARLVFLCADFVKFSKRPVNAVSQAVKCVVFDLDNTLWRGTLVEGDPVAIHPETVRLLKHLDERGILLSIASKNDHEAAWREIKRLGFADYFLYPQINWSPKSESVKTIARRLNIGLDALAFIDDNRFELDEVSRACPEILCISSDLIPTLFDDSRFRGSGTADSSRRRHLYREAEAREVAQASFGKDYLAFLAACEIHLEIWPFMPEDAERVAELVQRTNQLNFSGHKHTRSELEAVFANKQLEKLLLKSHDRYGAYGTIGFCIATRTRNAVLIQDLMLSCRVQGKLLERALFQHLVMHHGTDEQTKLWINFHKTDRNTPAQNTLQSLGFRRCELAQDSFPTGMILDGTSSLSSDLIQVTCACHSDRADFLPDALHTSAGA